MLRPVYVWFYLFLLSAPPKQQSQAFWSKNYGVNLVKRNIEPPLESENFVHWFGLDHQGASQKHIKNIYQLEKVASKIFSNKKSSSLAPSEYHDFLTRIGLLDLCDIIKSILMNPIKLQEIAKRSYQHYLGFSKIVLVSGSKDRPFKVRLHIWWPNQKNSSRPLYLEERHVHRWDFGSRMYSGCFENQIYELKNASVEQKKLFREYEQRKILLSNENAEKLDRGLAVLDNLSYPKSSLIHHRVIKDKPYKEYTTIVKQNLGFSDQDLQIFLPVFKKYYTSNNVSGKFGLTEAGLVAAGKPRVSKVCVGDVYFQGHELAHRIVANTDKITSTLIVTGFPMNDKNPFVFLRENSQFQSERRAPFLSVLELKELLVKYLSHLQYQMI